MHKEMEKVIAIEVTHVRGVLVSRACCNKIKENIRMVFKILIVKLKLVEEKNFCVYLELTNIHCPK